MRTEILKASDPNALARSEKTLKKGQLVAFPTDTVYGVGAALYDLQAIEQLFVVKGRESTKAIAVLVGDFVDIDHISDTPNRMARLLAERFWPGPLTLVVPRGSKLPSILSPLPTIGIRMPNHPIALKLLRLCGPLAVTSANLSGAPNSTTAQEVYQQLQGKIRLILDGGVSPGGEPSTVVDCLGEKPIIIRQGPINLEDLLAVAG